MLFRAALADQWEQNKRTAELQAERAGPHRRRPPPGRGRDPDHAAAERGQRRQERQRRLQPVPVPGLRGVPARLLLPAAADRRLHPRPPRHEERGRLRAAGPVPGHPGVRAAGPHLPRGRPVRGAPRPVATRRGRGGPAPSRRTAAPAAATTTRSRPATTAARCATSSFTASQYGLLPLHTVFTRQRQRITSDEEERRRAGFRIVTSYRFQDHGDRPGRLDATAHDADGKPVTRLTYGDSALVRRTNLGPTRRPAGRGGRLLARTQSPATG